jgi:hypothetical protein
LGAIKEVAGQLKSTGKQKEKQKTAPSPSPDLQGGGKPKTQSQGKPDSSGDRPTILNAG